MLPFTERAKFARLSRLLKGWGHELRQCPQDSPHFVERGRYYIVADDGGIAANVDLAFWLKELGKPSTQRWQVMVMFALYKLEAEGRLKRVEGEPGTWVCCEPQPTTALEVA
jgi:hypothetical protein